MTAEGSVMDQQREKSLSMDDLYGEGKAYPEPYNAGMTQRVHAEPFIQHTLHRNCRDFAFEN